MFTNIRNAIKAVGNFLQSPLLLIVRLYWGYQFMITGYGKFLHLQDISDYFSSLNIPLPYFNAVMASSTELICGTFLLLGLFSRIAAIPLFVVMAVAYLTASYDSIISLIHDFDPEPFFNQTPFLFAYAVILVFCFGPGKISFDYWLTGAYKNKIMP